MEEEDDLIRILKGSPWVHRNACLVLHPWDGVSDFKNLDYQHVPTWVQTWGIPPSIRTKQMGAKIGNKLGQVMEAELYQYPEKETLVKVKVMLDVNKPIKPGLCMGNHMEETTWLDFRYERLPAFCFNCGIIGHLEDVCKSKNSNNKRPDYINPLGPWLRSTVFGRRIFDHIEMKFSSNPLKSPSYGDCSPISKELIRKMRELAIKGGTTKQKANQYNYVNNDKGKCWGGVYDTNSECYKEK